MISVPSGGLVPQENPNESVMNIFGVPKYTVNSPHNVGDGCTVRVGRTTPRSDSQAVPEDRHCGDSPLTRVPATC
jgi:hypothetical protein